MDLTRGLVPLADAGIADLRELVRAACDHWGVEMKPETVEKIVEDFLRPRDEFGGKAAVEVGLVWNPAVKLFQAPSWVNRQFLPRERAIF